MNEEYRNRFWSKVQVGAEDECWDWSGSMAPDGFGRIYMDGRFFRAHNLAWAFANDCEYPTKLTRIHHYCQSDTCCNPKHLYRASRGADVPEEFWHDVQVGNDEECWPWQGPCTVDGYPITRKDGKSYKAHRLAWEIANGRELKKSECLNWTCGCKSCCNPNHLYIKSERDDTVERFWQYVDIKGEDDCWDWQAAKCNNGYGRFWDRHQQRMEAAHRMAWMLTNGPIPDGEGYHGTEVMHVVCDRPCCCNPKHLQLGSHADNMMDMTKKGRCNNVNHGNYLLGEKHHQSRLTVDQVREIKLSRGISHRALGDKYGVSHGTIGDIIRGKNWKHVTV